MNPVVVAGPFSGVSPGRGVLESHVVITVQSRCRNLSQEVDKFIVCVPRRNKLISSEGGRDEKTDSGKLVALPRGNRVRAAVSFHSSGAKGNVVEFDQTDLLAKLENLDK